MIQHVKTQRELRRLQRFVARALFRPLTGDDELAPRWVDGRSMHDVAAEVIRPGAHLTSFERLQIYARCYWYRVTASVHEDCPGLRALLGAKRFDVMVQAYLARYPSRSFTLRNLCQRLPQFVREAPEYTRPDTELAHTIARFEWAQTVAFDAGQKPPLTGAEISSTPPTRLKLGLQPHITLLDVDWPVDTYVIAVKAREARRDVASNTVDTHAKREKSAPVRKPQRIRTHIVVHRYRQRLYYRRESAESFALLSELAGGRSLSRAVASVGGIEPAQVHEWFSTWMELGWFCRPDKSHPPSAIR